VSGHHNLSHPALTPRIQWWMSYDCFDVPGLPPSLVCWHFGPKIIAEATSELTTVKCSLQAICKWRSLQAINSFKLFVLVVCSMQQEH